jgi:hypothetical protein
MALKFVILLSLMLLSVSLNHASKILYVMLRTGFSSLGNFSTNLLKISIPLFWANGILLKTILYAKSFNMFLSFPIIFYKSLTLSSILVKDSVLQVVLIFDSLDYFSANKIYFVLSSVVRIS